MPAGGYIDTSRPVTVKLAAGGITILGRAPEMLRLVHVTDEAEDCRSALAPRRNQNGSIPRLAAKAVMLGRMPWPCSVFGIYPSFLDLLNAGRSQPVARLAIR